MAEISKPQAPQTKPRKQFKLTDIIVFVVLLAIIVALAVTLQSKLSLKHEVSAARTVSDRVVSDIAKQNASDARSLGDAKFQAAHSVAQLKDLFASAGNFTGSKSQIERQTVSNSSRAKIVYVIYKYGGKQPYFIRIAVSQAHGSSKWQLIGISGNDSEAALVVK